ncbi:MAG TPA: glycosyltransferase, partial [Bacteroidales bacterium]|nr:glycosyltransferase [Bacteroidales bacterium]
DLYAEKYGVRPMVVRNLSESYSDFPAVSRDFTGINKDDFLVILQGTGINIDKGAEELTDAIALTEGTSLIIVGSGDVITDIERKVMDQHLEDRIKFFGPVDSKTLAGYTRMADAGMCLEKDTNINYRYSLPNKLFDYLSAGIPVICSKLPETAGIISNHKCGLLLEAVTPFEIAKAITLLKDDDSLYRGLRNNAEKAGAILTWEEESIVVKELYGNIISKIKDGKN